VPHYKLREEWESRFVSEYIEARFPNTLKKIRVPLGPVRQEDIDVYGLMAAARRMRAFRPEVDAVVVTKRELILVEGKLMKVLDGYAKLIVYSALVDETPELSDYHALNRRMILATPKPPTWALSIAQRFDVEIDIYRPEWLAGYYNRQEKYWTAEGRYERERRKKAMRDIGLK
jgi:hypothetical protein